MRITPLDIRKQTFTKAFRGLDPDQVAAFLEQVANEFEALVQSTDETATKLKVFEGELDHYRRIEKTLNETLLTAQRATDEARVNAQKEAELIIKDAQLRAGRYEHDARKRVYTLEAELITLKSQRDSFFARFRAMLKTQMGLLDTISEDLGSKKAMARAMAEEETLEDVGPSSTIDVIGDGLVNDR